MFVDYDHMRHMYEDDAKRNAAFPQITTFIRKKFYFPFRGHSEAREYSAELWIRKPTTVALLSAILRYPIAWTFGGQEQFLHPVDNIYWIEVASEGPLVRGDCNPGDLFRSKSPAYRVSIGADAADVPTETQRATIRELERFFLPVDSSPLVVRKHRVTIGTNFSLMGLWLEQVMQQRSRCGAAELTHIYCDSYPDGLRWNRVSARHSRYPTTTMSRQKLS
jgi:hypothetical protein